MYHSRRLLTHVLMALLIAVAPLQGVSAALASVAGDEDAGQQMGMSGMEMPHSQHASAAIVDDAAETTMDQQQTLQTRCDCCPEDQPSACGNCAVTHCATSHCASAAVLPLAAAGVGINAAVLPSLQASSDLPLSTLTAPFRPPRA